MTTVTRESIDTRRPPRARSRPSWRSVLGHALAGLAVFAGSVGGWFAFQHYRLMHTPLPDAGGPQGRCVVWFVGSSSIFRWTTLATDMKPWITHNRGVGGALLPELVQRFANEGAVTPPEALVFYAGDNDIAHGETVEAAVGHFRAFLAARAARMPHTPVLVISVKPSPKRFGERRTQMAYDDALRGIARQTPGMAFVDASAGLLVNGRPGPYFVNDGIHLNPAGYRIWAPAVRHALTTDLPAATVGRCAGKAALSSAGAR